VLVQSVLMGMTVVLLKVCDDRLGGNRNWVLPSLYEADDAAANFLSLTFFGAQSAVLSGGFFSLVMIIFSLVDGH